MHEAGHLCHSKIIPDEFFKDKAKHGILNAIEDVRVDLKNFSLLPNVKGFYEEGMKYDVSKRPPPAEIPFAKKVLINGIYALEGLSGGKIKDKDVEEFSSKHQISFKMSLAKEHIESRDWTELRSIIDEIHDLLKEQAESDPKKKKGEGGTGEEGELDTDLTGLKGNKAVWEGNNTGPAPSEVGNITVGDITRQKFKDLLNIRETRTVDSGTTLDTDNLISYFTGDIDTLFKEEKYEHKKLSQILLLLDGSGSMKDHLLDKVSRRQAVVSCCQELINILKEVQDAEGVCVDWKIRGFAGSYHPYEKENWRQEYLKLGGGTNLSNAFMKAVKDISKEAEVDGNRIIIILTDGEVTDQDLSYMKHALTTSATEIRTMVIGVGGDLTSSMIKEVCGGHNILDSQSADLVLLEAITDALE
jgi:uncharacterized protein YegL